MVSFWFSLSKNTFFFQIIYKINFSIGKIRDKWTYFQIVKWQKKSSKMWCFPSDIYVSGFININIRSMCWPGNKIKNVKNQTICLKKNMATAASHKKAKLTKKKTTVLLFHYIPSIINIWHFENAECDSINMNFDLLRIDNFFQKRNLLPLVNWMT